MLRKRPDKSEYLIDDDDADIVILQGDQINVGTLDKTPTVMRLSNKNELKLQLLIPQLDNH